MSSSVSIQNPPGVAALPDGRIAVPQGPGLGPDPDPKVIERLRAGEEDPPCTECGGILKTDTISFGQALIPEVIDRAMQVAQEADVLIAIGSTLQVYPVAGAVPLAKRNGARLVILNAQPTPFDDIADWVLNTSIGEALPYLCGS